MGMIPEKTVQEILDTAKVEEIIEDYVTLKRRGVNMIGLCPFHNEKTPSFTVSPSKNIYKCFGCGKGGGATQFLMEHDGMSFPEALRHLAKKYNIEIEEVATSPENQVARQYNESLLLVNQYAKEHYQDQLFNTGLGKSVGLSYFKDRGFREETIRKFGLGFAPDARDLFTNKAKGAGYQAEMLSNLGLTTQYGNDFFRNRVMFTIHNLSGKPIAFAGRILTANKKAPKYINSPETEVYNKSRVLYAAYFAKKAIRQKDECIMVEGYTDVISLHQAGIENVVASSGTSLTVEQIQLVKRYTSNMKILYDGDTAGVKAAMRGLDLVLEQDLNVKIVLLPEGEDPDSYLQRVGSGEFEKYLEEQAKDFILFKTSLLLEEAADDPIRKTELIKDIVGSIARIPDPIKRSIYTQRCATIMQVPEQLLVEETNKTATLYMRKQRQQERRAEQRQEIQANRKQPQSQRPRPTSSDPSFPDAPPPMSDEEMEAYPQENPGQAPVEEAAPEAAHQDEYQEKDIIRILISSGGEIYDKEEQTTVAQYILDNVKEVVDYLDNPLFKDIIAIIRERLQSRKEINSSFFVNHSREDIRELSVNLLQSPFEYSPNWSEKFGIELQTQPAPEQNFSNDSEQAVKRFKLRKIGQILKMNHERIKEAQDRDDDRTFMQYLKVEMKLKKMQMELAKELNTVILR